MAGKKLASANGTTRTVGAPKIRWFPEANVSPTSSARTKTDSEVKAVPARSRASK
jgi:hypothetical protein